jgi:hypothetical protein
MYKASDRTINLMGQLDAVQIRLAPEEESKLLCVSIIRA